MGFVRTVLLCTDQKLTQGEISPVTRIEITEGVELRSFRSNLWDSGNSSSLGLLPDSVALSHWDHDPIRLPVLWPSPAPTPISYHHPDS